MTETKITLGEVTEVLSGFAFDSKSFNTATGMPLIRIRDVVRGYTDTKYDGSYNSTYIIQDGELLIGMDGEFNIAPWSGGEALLNQRVCKISSRDPKVLDNRYLLHFLPGELKRIEAKTPFVTVKHLSVKDIKNIAFVLPPLHIQQQIADTMDKADALRRKDQELLQKYDELAHSIFYDMFGDPIRNEKGWQKEKLGTLCVIKRGASPRPIDKFIGKDVHWIKIGDGTGEDDMYITDTKVKITKEGSTKSVLLQPGALIFANCGVSLGFARILQIPGCIHDGWLSMEVTDNNVLNQVFLLKLINTLTGYLRGLAPEGTQPNLNTGIMKDLQIIVPPIELQWQFAETVEKLLSYKKHLVQQAENSNNLASSLLHKHF